MDIRQLLVEALRKGIRGEKVNWVQLSATEWQELLQLAQRQHVLPLLVEATYDCPAFVALPQTQQRELKMAAVRISAVQTQATARFLQLYTELAQTGRCLVMKGLACRQLYPIPSLRPSADEDILVSEDDFAACCDFFVQHGMTTQDDLSDFECGFHSQDGLHIELHRSPFSPDAHEMGQSNAYFAAAMSCAMTMDIEGVTVYTLNEYDHLLYLILHAYKHFIHSGFGVRQVCDIGLWAKTYEKEIDWDWLYALCEKSGTLYFTAAVFRMAKDVFQIDVGLSARWNEVETDPAPMLSDLLAGGIHGANDLSRLHSSTVTLGAVEASRKAQKHSVLQSVFPPRERLEKTYPELREHPAKLPLVWVKRLWKYAKETKNTKNDSAAESLRIAKERTELLKYYHIVR